MPLPDKTEGAIGSQETTTFTDETVGRMEMIPEGPDPTAISDQQDVASLASFLSRPVRVASGYWSMAIAAGTNFEQFSPWSAFFSDPRIKNKLHNFAFIRCDLHMKVVINASPFIYGLGAMTYQPLQVLTPSTIKGSGTQALIPRSQRPIVWFEPHKSKGGEMVLPFFYHKNWLTLKNTTELEQMGQCTLTSFTDLVSANGTADQAINIQVFAWAENVQLSGSTLSLAVQSKEDEYGTGPVSAPASTVARIAGSLKRVPVIGRFATATEIGAKAVAGIAKIFGFTNVPVISDVQPYQPRAFAPLASTEIGFPNDKLTLDPKNELTLDGACVGAPTEDPLALDNLVTRESLIKLATWGTADQSDEILFYSRVNPWMFDTSGDTDNSIVQFTPLSLAAQLFEYWRGDIIFRFKFIASQYHKGRVMIAFDPVGDAVNNLTTVPVPTSAVYNTIVDLGVTDEAEIRVPYVQALAFLKTDPDYTLADVPFSTSGTPAFNVDHTRDNGCIVMRVLTQLTAPAASAPIKVAIFVRGAEGMEFGNPRRPGNRISHFHVESKEVSDDAGIIETLGEPSGDVPPEQFRVNFGERVKSLRVLLHRANYIYTYNNSTSANFPNVVTSVFGKLPPYYGYDPNGIFTANKVVGVGTAPFNFVKATPLSWILPCFVGYRGSGVWTFNCNNAGACGHVSVTRNPVDNMVWSDSMTNLAVSTSSIAAASFQSNLDSTAGGSALTNQVTQAGLSVLCPMYTQFRFNSTYPGNTTVAPTTPETEDGSATDTFYFKYVASNLNSSLSKTSGLLLDRYWHAGPDFQPVFFLNVPSQYRMVSTPTGA